jgi:C_GCAxxG_C_C family probable redox protein
MNEIVQKASDYFVNGLYCSQAVLGAFCEKYGMDTKTAFKISCGLNSGCRCAEICGAVSGAILVIGLKHGDSINNCNSETEKYIKTFIENNGEIICRKILNCDIFTPDGKEKAINENLFKTTCLEMVVNASQILVDLGY